MYENIYPALFVAKMSANGIKKKKHTISVCMNLCFCVYEFVHVCTSVCGLCVELCEHLHVGANKVFQKVGGSVKVARVDQLASLDN